MLWRQERQGPGRGTLRMPWGGHLVTMVLVVQGQGRGHRQEHSGDRDELWLGDRVQERIPVGWGHFEPPRSSLSQTWPLGSGTAPTGSSPARWLRDTRSPAAWDPSVCDGGWVRWAGVADAPGAGGWAEVSAVTQV